jgi:hypothetical protein
MTDPAQPTIGTVAQEAARLISAMAAMAGPSAVTTDSDDLTESGDPVGGDPSSGDDPADASGPYAGRPAGEPKPPRAERAVRTCSSCGAESDATPVACRVCPLCQGIALLRSVRPETVDRLADFATAVAGTLRDLATQSRAADPEQEAASRTGKPPDRATVQDIPVADEGEE